MYGDIVDRYLSVKFGVNLLDGFREKDNCNKRCLRMDDGRPRHDSSYLCASTKQS